MNKCQEWYNKNAERNSGYQSTAKYVKVGPSGEEAFKKKLMELLPHYQCVLDIGCGHGAFTLEMSRYTKRIIGGDSAVELLKIANKLKAAKGNENVDFIYLHTHELNETDEQKYDLIYNRRGPTSIYHHKHLLKPGGLVLGIHPLPALEQVKKRLGEGGFEIISLEIFNECQLIFDSIMEFADHMSSSHMSPDYLLAENKEALEKLIQDHRVDDQFVVKEDRFILMAK